MLALTVLLVLIGLLGLPAPAGAQLDLVGTVTGGLAPGITTVLGGTGPLTGTPGALDASALTGQISGLVNAEVLHAATVGDPGRVDSEASIANVALDVPGITLDADFVIAQATAVPGAGGAGSAAINNLLINGVPVAVSGAPNQTIALPVGRVVVNERISSPTGIVVNALHVTVPGAVDVIICSASADASTVTGQASAVQATGL
jgi:hypothetical protein